MREWFIRRLQSVESRLAGTVIEQRRFADFQAYETWLSSYGFDDGVQWALAEVVAEVGLAPIVSRRVVVDIVDRLRGND